MIEMKINKNVNKNEYIYRVMFMRMIYYNIQECTCGFGFNVHAYLGSAPTRAPIRFRQVLALFVHF